jgi:hypothetical protein
VRYFNAFGRPALYDYEPKVVAYRAELVMRAILGGQFCDTRHGLAKDGRQNAPAVAAACSCHEI